MLKPAVAILLLSLAPIPAVAQTAPDLGTRVNRIEKELRAVQRKVFPGGTPLEPEIAPAPVAATSGSPATSAIADLTARVGAMETQLRTLTGQAEQNGFRLGQLEEKVRSLAEAQAVTPAAPVAGPAPAVAVPEATVAESAAASAIERPATGDAAEDGYIYGFRLWQAKRFTEAQAELKKVAETYPDHRRASFAQNLLGRALYDDGNPAQAAVALYDGYKKWPKGERAPESLYWLGQALTQLKRPADACKVYAEFGDVYGATAPASLKTQIVAGQKKAKCS